MSKRQVTYGGAEFSSDCPVCEKPLRIPKSLCVNTFISQMGKNETPHVLGSCRKHGKQTMQFLKFTG